MVWLTCLFFVQIANIMDAYALPIRTPLSHTMNGSFLCSGLGTISRLEHACRPNATYFLEHTVIKLFRVTR
jgi:hypothetical protein